MRDEQDLKITIDKYSDTVLRICMLYLKSSADTDDIFQNVFLKYLKSSVHFENEEHKKAFIIRVTINECKDLIKSFFRKNIVSIDNIIEPISKPEIDKNYYIRQAVFNLPNKYKTVIYLYYFEGYSAVEIAKNLGKNVNTIYTLLSRGKQMLKDVLGGMDYE